MNIFRNKVGTIRGEYWIYFIISVIGLIPAALGMPSQTIEEYIGLAMTIVCGAFAMIKVSRGGFKEWGNWQFLLFMCPLATFVFGLLLYYWVIKSIV